MLAWRLWGTLGPRRAPAIAGSRRLILTTGPDVAPGSEPRRATSRNVRGWTPGRPGPRRRTGRPRDRAGGVGLLPANGTRRIERSVAVEDPGRSRERLTVAGAAGDLGVDDARGKLDVSPPEDEGRILELVAVDPPGEAADRSRPAQPDRRRVDLGRVEPRGSEDADPDVRGVRGVDVAILVRIDQHGGRHGGADGEGPASGGSGRPGGPTAGGRRPRRCRCRRRSRRRPRWRTVLSAVSAWPVIDW